MVTADGALQIKRIDKTLRRNFSIVCAVFAGALAAYFIISYTGSSTFISIVAALFLFVPVAILTWFVFNNAPFLVCPSCESRIYSLEHWICQCGHTNKNVIFHYFARYCGFCHNSPTSLRCPACRRNIVFNRNAYRPEKPQEGRAIVLYDVGVEPDVEPVAVQQEEVNEVEREVESLIAHTLSLTDAVEKLTRKRDELIRKHESRDDISEEQKAGIIDLIETQVEQGVIRLRKIKAKGAG